MIAKATQIRVRGHVQGVYYRQSCRAEARALGLVGWVRNHSDGSVEIVAQGDAAAVDRLIDWAWVGPSGATVTGLESESVSLDHTLADFLIQPGPGR